MEGTLSPSPLINSMSIREMIEKLVSKGYYRAGVESLEEKKIMKLAKKENLI